MPHIIVKLYPGRSEAQKEKLAQRIAKDVVDIAGCKERSVSVAVEEVEEKDWIQKVYEPDIINGPATLYKKPGYDPFGPGRDDGEEAGKSLKDHVREAAKRAELEDTSGFFNPMSWLDLELEDHPQSFDPCFDTPWDQLSDQDKAQRTIEIRRVL